MASITTRAGKGSALTSAEVDANFTSLNAELLGKQDALVSGTSIKTVNGQSILGSGNIQIDGGVTSFNTRTGAVTLGSSDVTTALGYTPANKAGDTFSGVVNASVGLGIGTAALNSNSLRIAKTITGAAATAGVSQFGQVQSDVTTQVLSFNSQANTAAESFTLTDYVHYYAQQGTLGAGSALTNQTAFWAHSSITSGGSGNVYGFRGSLSASANRWNFFADGTAQNYLAGNLLIGSSSLANGKVVIGGNLTGQSLMSALRAEMTIQSDVTTGARGFQTLLGTQAASFTLPDIIHYRAVQAAFGAGSTVTSQNAFVADASLVGAGTNIGFRGAIPSGTNRWNMYMDGTASNFIAGATILNNALGFGAAASPNYGTSGQVLKSAGTGAAPAWSSLSSSDITTALGFTPVNKAGDTMTGDLTATNFIGPGTGLTGTAASLTAGNATKLATARSLTMTGDVTGSFTFNGAANVSTATTLASSGVVAGTYTNPTITVDSKGRVTYAATGAGGGGGGGGTVYSVTTSTSTPTVIATVTSALYTAYFLSVKIVAKRLGGTEDYGAWVIRGLAATSSTNPADIGQLYEEVIARTNAALTVDIVSSAAGIQVFVTGVADQSYLWKASVEVLDA